MKEINIKDTEKLIEIGDAAKEKVQKCRSAVKTATKNVADAKRNVAAAAGANGKGVTDANKARAQAQLAYAEKKLEESKRALDEARAELEQNRISKKEQIKALEEFGRKEKSKLENLNELKKHAFNENARKPIEATVQKLNEAERARAALVNSMGGSAAAKHYEAGRFGGKTGWNVEVGGPLHLEADASSARKDGSHEIERRLDVYRAAIVGLGIPDNDELNAFMNVLREHYTKELDEKLNGRQNCYDEAPNFDTIKKLGIPFLMNMHVRLQNCKYPEVSRLFELTLNGCKIGDANYTGGGAFFSPGAGVYFNKDTDAAGDSYNAPYEVAFHELGHNVDYLLGVCGVDYSVQYNNNELGKAMKADVQNLMLVKGCKTYEQLIESVKADVASNGWSKREIANLSDALESITRIPFPLRFGHGADYWNHIPPNVEFFTEVMSCALTNEKGYEVLKRYFPGAVEVVHKMVKDKVNMK